MRTLPHAVTIFVSALLLFTVQLVIAKAILPWFGGTPAVWTTCLVFFQALLTCGYAYAHGSIRWLSPRVQAVLHTLLVVAAGSALVLCWRSWGTPIIPDGSWKPLDGDHPVRDILLLLTAATALPYLALSSTSPLIQAWFARAFPDRSAVRLYALSNVGSLLGLVSYPFVIEPHLGVHHQGLAWALLFGVFAVGSLACAARAASDAAEEPQDEADPWPGWPRCAWWFTLAACGSMLLMATSNQISQDISTSPLLMMLPLVTYLLTFILCFDRERTYDRTIFSWLFGASMLVTVWDLQEAALHDPRLALAAALLSLFTGCMICHGELVRSRPGPSHLTLFYLMMSIGGAVGGGFVSLGAPVLFGGVWEMQISVLAVAVVLLGALMGDGSSWLYGPPKVLVPLAGVALGVGALATPALLMRLDKSLPPIAWAQGAAAILAPWMVGVLVGTALLVVGLMQISVQLRLGLQKGRGQATLVGVALLAAMFSAALLVTARPFSWTDLSFVRRNFYGVTRVLDLKTVKVLVHGSTFHGWQMLDKPRQTTGYYGPGSGLQVAFTALQSIRPALSVCVFGLGAGQMAAYLRPSDRLVYYEIDPHMIDVATGPDAQFSFVADSPGKVETVRGDARLSLERSDRQFDLLVIDAFSSDSIPTHLLTREAFEMYSRHLKPDGVFVIHISNRYLDLVPVVRRQLGDQGFATAFAFGSSHESWQVPRRWAIASRQRSFLDLPMVAAVLSPEVNQPPLARPWTDDWSDVLQVLQK